MAQVSKYLRKSSVGYIHYCPGCEDMHHFYTNGKMHANWSFNGNVEKPTFEPSMRVFSSARNGKPERTWCHYFLRDGVIEFLDDSSGHKLRGKVPLPELPEFAQGDKYGDGNNDDSRST